MLVGSGVVGVVVMMVVWMLAFMPMRLHVPEAGCSAGHHDYWDPADTILM